MKYVLVWAGTLAHYFTILFIIIFSSNIEHTLSQETTTMKHQSFAYATFLLFAITRNYAESKMIMKERQITEIVSSRKQEISITDNEDGNVIDEEGNAQAYEKEFMPKLDDTDGEVFDQAFVEENFMPELITTSKTFEPITYPSTMPRMSLKSTTYPSTIPTDSSTIMTAPFYVELDYEPSSQPSSQPHILIDVTVSQKNEIIQSKSNSVGVMSIVAGSLLMVVVAFITFNIIQRVNLSKFTGVISPSASIVRSNSIFHAGSDFSSESDGSFYGPDGKYYGADGTIEVVDWNQ